jgi:hypothetical protein
VLHSIEWADGETEMMSAVVAHLWEDGDVIVYGEVGPEVGDIGTESRRLSDVALDLRDPLGADIAARWLAERCGVDATGGLLWAYREDDDEWWLTNRDTFSAAFGGAKPTHPMNVYSGIVACVHVPALAAIDPASPDADPRALAACALHVAALAPKEPQP